MGIGLNAVKNLSRTAILAIPTMAPNATRNVLLSIIDVAIRGVGKFPGARHTAGHQLAASKGNVDAAIATIIRNHWMLAGAQGFVTNLGGLVTLPVSMPANLAGLATIEVRMVAAIAHLRGYELDDPRVRAAVLMCLLGAQQNDKLVAAGELPSTPIGVATAPIADPELEQQIATKILDQLLAQFGGKQAVAVLAKRIPVIGGGVGAATDGYSTRSIGRYAAKQFVSRRAIDRAGVESDAS